MIKLGFSGSRFKFARDPSNAYRLVYKLVHNILSKYSPSNTIIGHGDSPQFSVDQVVDKVARELGFTVVKFTPRALTREALLERNRRLVEWCDKLITIFIDGYTRGTLYTLNYAKKIGREYEIHLINSQR